MKTKLYRIFSVMMVLAMLLPATALAQTPTLSIPETSETVAAPVDVAEKAVYIIRLTDAPIASYDGSIDGYAATSPAILGESKLSNTADTNAYLGYLQNTQAAFISGMESAFGRSVNVTYTYQHAFNGMAVEMTVAEAKTVSMLSGVAAVTIETIEYPLTDVGPEWIGAPGIWDGTDTGGLPGTMGEDVVVAILDTGINSDHPSFADIGDDGYDHTNPLGSGTYIPGSYCIANPTFCNDKLIGAWSFVTEAITPEDSDSHGSHTASTVAGNVVTSTLEAPTAAHTDTISGVAPHANIIAYDVCTEGCPGAALLAAVNQVVVDSAALPNGIAAINYSISGGSNPYYDQVELAFLAATDAGVFVSTSAGNNGPGAGTVAHISPWVSTVGASTHDRVVENTLMNMSSDAGAGPSDMVGAGFTAGYGPALIVHAVDAGDAQCLTPFPAGTWTNGEIVVCDRGTIARTAKGQNVLAGGAGGFVLANVDAQGESIVSDGHYLPGVHIGDTAGDILRAWLADPANTNAVATISGYVFNRADANGDIMADFSSRGPAGALPVLKPDITAPGVSIWAAYANGAAPNHPEYGFMGGTSMSSPHNAGAATLMTALHPTWTPHQIKSAMMTTAYNGATLFKEDGVTPVDAFDLGSGRVELGNAGAAGLVLDETKANFDAANPVIGGDPGTLNIANFYNDECLDECSWTRTVSSTQAVPITWTASIDAPAGMLITVEPATFTLAPYATQQITVTAGVTGTTPHTYTFASVSLSPPLTTIPFFTEDFEGGVFPPTGWSVVNNGGDCDWVGDDPGSNGNLTGATGDFATADSDACGSGTTMDTTMYSPIVDVSTLSNIVLEFNYDYRDASWAADGFEVDVSADGGTTWTNIATWTSNDRGPALFSQDVTAELGGSTQAQIRFRYYAPDWDWWVQVDDVFMGEASGLPAAHFPVVTYRTLVPPTIDVEPTSMATMQDSGVVTTLPMTITNIGAPDADLLNWTIRDTELPAGHVLVDWSDGFEAYAVGSNINGQGGWVSWSGGDADGAIVTDTLAYSGTNSLDVVGPSDITHPYSGYDTGWWIFNTQAYVPSDFDGQSYFILLSGDKTGWAVQVNFDSASGLLVNDGASGGQMPYITDQWVEISVEIDLVNDTVDFYYDGSLLYSGTWTAEHSGATLNIGMVDLYANGASSVFYDDLALFETIPDPCDTYVDLPWVSATPDSGSNAPGTGSVVDIDFDSTGLFIGLYEGTICVESNDPVTPAWAVPVSMTVTSDPPNMVVNPALFESTQAPNTIVAQTLTISNTGMGDLDWDIFEDAGTMRLPFGVPFMAPAAAVAGTQITFGDLNLSTSGNSDLVPSAAPASPDRGDADVTITHSASQDITAGNSANCGSGTPRRHADNSYLRKFNLNAFGITQDFAISSIDIGIETAEGTGGTQPATVNLYTWNPADAFVFANFTLIGTADTTVDDQTLTVLNVPVAGTAPAGSTLVVEVFTPDGNAGGHNIFIGSNAAGQTDPSYLAAAACGLPEPTDTAAIGFPDMHIVMNVTGAEMAASSVCDAPDDIAWLSVSPISGTVVGGAAALVDVAFDSTSMASGTYTGTLCLASNDPVLPLAAFPLTMTVSGGYDVDLSGDDALSGVPGEDVVYTLAITNTGVLSDIYTIDVTGTWTATYPMSITLDAGATDTFDVIVSIPAAANHGDFDVASVTATSDNEPVMSDSADLTTTVVVPPSVTKIGPATAFNGDVISYTIVLDVVETLTGTAMLTDTLPAGVSYVSGTVTSTFGTAWYDSGDNAVYWSYAAAPPIVSASAPASDAPALMPNAGLDAAASDGYLTTMAAPQATNAVLWEQLADGSGSGIISDYFTNNGLGTYSADDFVLAYPATLESIFVDGFVNTDDLTDAEALNWYIYADASGEPAGYPSDGGGTEIWTLTTTVTDTAVTIMTDTVTLDIVAALGAGLDLAPGTYWLSFFPDIDHSVYERFNWYRAVANGSDEAMLYDDGNFGGMPWTELNALLGPGWDNLAFRLEGTIPPAEVTITFDAMVTATTGDVVTNTAEMDYNGMMYAGDTSFTTLGYGVDLSGNLAMSGAPGDVLTYTVSITNTGYVTDTFDLTATGNLWPTTFSAPSISLADGATGTFDVYVAIPASASDGEMDATNVHATSQADPAATDYTSVDTTADIPGYLIYLPLIFR